MYVQYKKIIKKFADFIIFLRAFFTKIKNFWTQKFVILSIHKPFLGSHLRFHKKFGPDRFSRFDVFWIQTDRHIDKQSLYIEC